MGDGGSESDGEHYGVCVLVSCEGRGALFISPVRSRFEPSLLSGFLDAQSSPLPSNLLIPSLMSSSSLGRPSQPRVSKPATQIPKFPVSSDSRSDTDCSRSARFLSSSVPERVCPFSPRIHPDANTHTQLYRFVPAWISSRACTSGNSRFTTSAKGSTTTSPRLHPASTARKFIRNLAPPLLRLQMTTSVP
jgi:hypothetical protein